MSFNIGAGLGASCGIGAQGTWGGALASFTRFPPVKSLSATWDPKIIQGGPYLRGQSSGGDVGSARLTLLPMSNSTSGPIAKWTVSGDFQNTAMALWLACALGTSATMTQLSATTAYELGGASGTSLSDPVGNSTYFDMQWGIPTTDGTVHPFTFHSCVTTDATLTFDRSGLVTYEYGGLAQFVEATTALTTPTQPTGFVPFAMSNPSCLFEAGAVGSESAISGAKKAVLKITRKQYEDGLYLGNMTLSVPTTIDNWKGTLAVDLDYTSAAKAIYDQFAAGTFKSFVMTSVGNVIGSSGHSDTLSLNATNCGVMSGGEPNPKGPGIISSTVNLDWTVDPAGDAQLKAVLISADTAF